MWVSCQSATLIYTVPNSGSVLWNWIWNYEIKHGLVNRSVFIYSHFSATRLSWFIIHIACMTGSHICSFSLFKIPKLSVVLLYWSLKRMIKRIEDQDIDHVRYGYAHYQLQRTQQGNEGGKKRNKKKSTSSSCTIHHVGEMTFFFSMMAFTPPLCNLFSSCHQKSDS